MTEELQKLLSEHNLTLDMFKNTDVNNVYPLSFAIDLLKLCGLTTDEITFVLFGIDSNKVKADLEYCEGWNQYHSWYASKFALDAYNSMIIENDPTVSVGMKYPNFNAKQFISKYELSLVATLETKHSIEWRELKPDAKKHMYDVYSDPLGNIYSFEPNRIGKGGYAGFVFNDTKTAFKFIKDYLNAKSRYVKDIDILHNGLGGFSKNDVNHHKDQFKAITIN